ncbi:MAG: HEAT repeat domain-containing protein [Pirellulaceae bacterium]
MQRCLICLVLLSTVAVGCHDGPLYALKRANPVFQRQWKQDEALGVTDHRRREELKKLARSIDGYRVEEQAKWLLHLQEIMEHDPSAEMRHLAVRAAEKIAGAGALALIEEGLEDENLKVQMAACEVLGERPESAAMVRLAKTAGSSIDRDVRQAALRALRRHEGEQVNEALKLALADSDPAIRYTAIDSLKTVTGKDLGNRPDVWIAYLNGESVENDEKNGFSISDLF